MIRDIRGHFNYFRTILRLLEQLLRMLIAIIDEKGSIPTFYIQVRSLQRAAVIVPRQVPLTLIDFVNYPIIVRYEDITLNEISKERRLTDDYLGLGGIANLRSAKILKQQAEYINPVIPPPALVRQVHQTITTNTITCGERCVGHKSSVVLSIFRLATLTSGPTPLQCCRAAKTVTTTTNKAAYSAVALHPVCISQLSTCRSIS